MSRMIDVRTVSAVIHLVGHIVRGVIRMRGFNRPFLFGMIHDILFRPLMTIVR